MQARRPIAAPRPSHALGACLCELQDAVSILLERGAAKASQRLRRQRGAWVAAAHRKQRLYLRPAAAQASLRSKPGCAADEGRVGGQARPPRLLLL